MTNFPITRLRRNRNTEWIRDIVAENRLTPSDLIMPFFVVEGENLKEPIGSMPDCYRYSIDNLIKEVEKAKSVGIKSVIIFPVIDTKLKDEQALEAFNENNLHARAVKAIKQNVPDIGVIADVALDPYTSHGHDGVLVNNYVDNDLSLELLAKQALVLAKAGADIVSPSDMMDGRVIRIRKELDNAGFINVSILSYSAKYASNFYGPFRDALGSAKNLGTSNKKSYQMDFRNSKEAMREIKLDLKEGADIIMIKPALSYLDVIKMAKDNFNVPIVAYQVSGEYSMLKASSQLGYLNFDNTMYETLISMKRAGANAIISYAAIYIAEKLCQNYYN